MDTTNFTLVIDDIDIEHYNMKLVSYQSQSYVKRKVTGTDIPGAHGTQTVPSALSTSSFVADVICVGETPDDVHTRIRQFLAYMYSTHTAHRIVFTDDISIARYAILDSPDKYKVIQGVDGAFAELKLNFYMLDPFMYESEADRTTKDTRHGSELVIYNEAFECPAIFTIENKNQQMRVSDIGLIVNGELVSFSCELAPGDKLVLDTVEYEVRLNGVLRLDLWSGEMPMLKNGNNVIIQQNTQFANLLVSVEFTKQWV